LLQFNAILPRTRNAKKLQCFNFLYFHKVLLKPKFQSLLELVIMNGIILLREGWWLKRSVGQQQIILLLTLWSQLTAKFWFSGLFCDRDPLLTDVCLLQGILA